MEIGPRAGNNLVVKGFNQAWVSPRALPATHTNTVNKWPKQQLFALFFFFFNCFTLQEEMLIGGKHKLILSLPKCFQIPEPRSPLIWVSISWKIIVPLPFLCKRWLVFLIQKYLFYIAIAVCQEQPESPSTRISWDSYKTSASLVRRWSLMKLKTGCPPVQR